MSTGHQGFSTINPVVDEIGKEQEYDIAYSYWGEFPIYELSGKTDTLDVTFSLQQECVVGSLKAKTKLFRKRGLTMRLVIDQSKGFPVITKVP